MHKAALFFLLGMAAGIASAQTFVDGKPWYAGQPAAAGVVSGVAQVAQTNSGQGFVQSGASGVATPSVQLQMPVGNGGMSLNIPLPGAAAVAKPGAVAAQSANQVSTAVQPLPYQMNLNEISQEINREPKPLKRSEVAGWPQIVPR